MEPVIETVGLTKQYGDNFAVRELNLTLRRGEVFGLLGPNGAGKTTTILMLLGLTEPTAGTVSVLGFDPGRQPLQVKARVGYLPDQVGFYDDLTARENLGYIAALNRIPRAEADTRIGGALTRMGLSAEALLRPVRTYSHGMRQRLGLAELLVKRAEIVILDEPTIGLDPEAAREFLVLVRSLKEDGITIMLSSHLLHQVQAICDRVGLFNRGRMVLEGTVGELAQKVLGGAYRIYLQAEGSDLMKRFEAIPGVVRVRRDGDREYLLEAAQDLRNAAAQAVVESEGRMLGLRLEQPSLDEVYARYFQEVGHANGA